MTNRFADKYKISSPRLKNHNYSSSGLYFITICTYRHNNFFGKIINNQMELSKMGIIVESELFKTFEIRKNIKLHQYVIMPNHIHLLIEIKYQIKNNNIHCRDVLQNVSTNNTNVSIYKTSEYFSKISPEPGSISNIIKQFKSAVTKQINPHKVFFAWQSRYHDHIVKDKQDYFTIKNYIKNNVINWEKDKFYKI